MKKKKASAGILPKNSILFRLFPLQSLVKSTGIVKKKVENKKGRNSFSAISAFFEDGGSYHHLTKTGSKGAIYNNHLPWMPKKKGGKGFTAPLPPDISNWVKNKLKVRYFIKL